LSKRIAILGSTGSIGCSTLDVVEHLGPPYRVAALSAHRQIDKLLDQVRRHRPPVVAVTDESSAQKIARPLRDLGIELLTGPNAMVELAQRSDVDIVLAAVVGAAGLPAAMAAVAAGKTLALANKESLVCAGSLLIPLARKNGVSILPVDSEHSAVFQAMHCGRGHEVKRVILTASGGPFRTATLDQIRNASLADALNHPTWKMGGKITIDSATMFNKALELIEAMVEFVDGSVIAQLSPPDMKTPIQYALTYPHRLPGSSPKLDLTKAFQFRFEPPDLDRFPAIRLAYEVARKGGTTGAVLNAANESAVSAFTSGKIAFGTISHLVELAHNPSLDDLLAADRWARTTVENLIQTHEAAVV